LFIMATNSSVSYNESDSAITIINDKYPLVIKEFFFECYAFHINMSYFLQQIALETRI